MLNTVAAHALLAGVPITTLLLLLLSFIEWIHRLPFFVFVVLWLDCQRLLNSTTSPPPAVVIWKHSLGLPIGLSPQLASHIRRQKFSIPRWGPSSWLPGSDIVIAAEKIGGIEFGFKHLQSGVIDPIGFTHAVPFALVQRVDVDLARIKRLHVVEKAPNPS